MDVLAKVAAFMGVGAIILALNLWYAKALYDSFGGGGIVIAPVKVFGADQKLVGLDERFVAAASVEHTRDRMGPRTVPGRAPGRACRLGGTNHWNRLSRLTRFRPRPSGSSGCLECPNLAGLDARLFEPASIEATVGGVDVGGLLPRVQRWFVQDRILALSASFVDEKTVIIAGDLNVLKSGNHSPLRLKVSAATTDSIAEEIAYELVRRRLSTSNSFYERLEPDEFKILVTSVSEVADINQRVGKYGIPAKGEYAEVSKGLSSLADELTSWGELNHFAASVAESAEDYQRPWYCMSEFESCLFRPRRRHNSMKRSLLSRIGPGSWSRKPTE